MVWGGRSLCAGQARDSDAPLPAHPLGLAAGTGGAWAQGIFRKKPESGPWHLDLRSLPRGRTQGVPSARQGHPALLSRLDPEPPPLQHLSSRNSHVCPRVLPSSRSPTGWFSTPSPGLRPPRLTCACEHLHLLRLPQPHSHPLQHTGDVVTGPVQAVVLNVPTHTPTVRKGQPELTCAGTCPALARTPPVVPNLGPPWPGALRPASPQEPVAATSTPFLSRPGAWSPWSARPATGGSRTRSGAPGPPALSPGEEELCLAFSVHSTQRPPLRRTAQWPP